MQELAAPGLRARLLECESAVGGGASPTVGLPTVAVAIDPGPEGPDRFAARLRSATPPVVARVVEGRVVVDLRTVGPDEEAQLGAALAQAAAAR